MDTDFEEEYAAEEEVEDIYEDTEALIDEGVINAEDEGFVKGWKEAM